MWPVLLAVSVIINLVLLGFLLSKRKKTGTVPAANSSETGSAPNEVGRFYDEQTTNFLKIYGEVIQAFRTHDLSNLLNYQIEAMDLQEGQVVCDAGCGVCGPARYFAKNAKVKVEAITISQEQVRIARERNAEEGLTDKINVTHGDYQMLHEHFQPEQFDVVYFLESFGHATNHGRAIDSAWGVLKNGGTLYIKDLFKKVTPLDSLKPEIEREVDNINKAYRYNIADLYEVIHHLRMKGFILASVKTIDLPLEDFENLTISNDFQELTGINKIENLQEYVFPVDFFEIKAYKPWHALEVGNNRYFLQNLYYMQVHNRKEQEL